MELQEKSLHGMELQEKWLHGMELQTKKRTEKDEI